MNGRLIAGCMTAGLLTAQLPGCNLTASVESMLSPPRLTMEQEQIYQALQIAAGSQISLKYPKSGERLSAFIVEDLDGDGSDEAVVFYERGRSAADENPLRICLLDQTNGGWNAISNEQAAGAEIDRVDLESLGSNPRMNLIISYSMVDGAEHAVQVFHYEDGQLIENRNDPYSVMALRDLDGDGTTELFLATAAKNTQPAKATVYALNPGGKYIQYDLSLPETLSDFSRVTYGMLPVGTGQEQIPVVYMDGSSGATNVQTVVLSYRDQQLSLLYADSADRFPKTERAGGYQTMDIDDDGEAEIPVNMAFYGSSNVTDPNSLRMTNWYVCRNSLLMREHSSYYSVQNNFVFLMPKRWEHRVTAVQENDEIVFYTFEQSQDNAAAETENAEPVLLDQLLRLAVVADPIAADAMQSEGYLLLRKQNSRYYLGRIGTGDSSMHLTQSELLVSMRFLQ